MSPRVLGWMTVAVWLWLAVAAVIAGHSAWQVAKSVRAEAVVVGTRSVGNQMYRTVLEWRTPEGETLPGSPVLASNLPPRDGTRLFVRYDPAAPQTVWTDDLIGTWFVPLLPGGIGGFFLLLLRFIRRFSHP